MRKAQRGYLDGLEGAILVVLILIGIFLGTAVPWLWAKLKPFLLAVLAG